MAMYYSYVAGIHYHYGDLIALHRSSGFISELAYRCTYDHHGGYTMNPLYWDRIRLVTMR